MHSSDTRFALGACLVHADATTARQYLAHSDVIVRECGGPIFSPLLGIDPVARHGYEYLEYKPLVNARPHAPGNRRQVVNAASTTSTTG